MSGVITRKFTVQLIEVTDGVEKHVKKLTFTATGTPQEVLAAMRRIVDLFKPNVLALRCRRNEA